MKRLIPIALVSMFAAGLFAGEIGGVVFTVTEHEKYWDTQVRSATYNYYMIFPAYAFSTNTPADIATGVDATVVEYGVANGHAYYTEWTDTFYVTRINTRGDFEIDWGEDFLWPEYALGNVAYDARHNTVTGGALDGVFINYYGGQGDIGTWSLRLDLPITSISANRTLNPLTLVETLLESKGYHLEAP